MVLLRCLKLFENIFRNFLVIFEGGISSFLGYIFFNLSDLELFEEAVRLMQLCSNYRNASFGNFCSWGANFLSIIYMKPYNKSYSSFQLS